MRSRICVILAALQVLLVPITARVISSHVSEEWEQKERFTRLLLSDGASNAAHEADFSRNSTDVYRNRFDAVSTYIFREKESADIVTLKPVTKGRSMFYSSSLFTCLKRLQNHKDDPHKPFWPLNWRDIVGYTFAALSLFIAAGGGIGGGGILVPLFILVMEFPTNTAVALSNITIVGGAISNFVFNVGRRHAFFKRPLIDWNIILAMEPATILGALLGGYLNKATPNWMTTILLAVLLSLLTYKLVDRALVTWRKENADFKRVAAATAGGPDATAEATRPLLQGDALEHQEILNSAFAPDALARQSTEPIAVGGRRTSDSEAAVVVAGEGTAHHSSPLAYTTLGLEGAEGAPLSGSLGSSIRSKSLIRRVSLAERARIGSHSSIPALDEESHGEAPAIPEETSGEPARSTASAAAGAGAGAEGNVVCKSSIVDKVLEADDNKSEPQVPPIKLLLLVFMFACIVASDMLKDNTVCGSWQYWLVVLSVVPVILIISLIVRTYLLRDFAAKQASGYVWTEGDVEWSARNTLLFPALSSLAGLIAGMFGVGGGIVKGPLMLEMGVLPDVAAATSATMIMFTAASASVVYLSFGGIPFDYGLTTFLVGLIFTMIGQVACYWLMRMLNRRSVVVIAMALLMLISMAIIYYEAVVATISAIQDHRLLDFGTICVGEK